MRKLLALFISVLLLFSLVACGGDPQGDESSSAPTTTETQLPSSSDLAFTTTLPTAPTTSTPAMSDPTMPTTGPTTPIVTDPTPTQTQPSTAPTTAVPTTSVPSSSGQAVILTQQTQATTVPSSIAPTTPSANAPTTQPTTQPTTAPTQPAPEQKIILCWGDSLTDGMGMENYSGNKYPDALQSLLGDEYKVYNGGYSGDKSIAIMARQGAVKLKTKDAITFNAGEKTVKLGLRKDGFNFLMDDGNLLNGMNVQIGSGATKRSLNYLLLNPITIGGESYKLGITFDGVAKVEDGAYYVTLSRDDASAAKTIPAGSPVVLGNSNMSSKSYCEVILMGANDGLQTTEADTQLLISRYQKMIDHLGHDRYIVIIPYWGNGAHTEGFKKAFGNKAICLFDEITEESMKSVGVTPTASDLSMLQKKVIPISLQYSHDNLHLNKYGYKLIAKFVYERGQQLGYWK